MRTHMPTKLLMKDSKGVYIDGFTVPWFSKMKDQAKKKRESCSKLS